MANTQAKFGFRHIGFLPGFAPDYQINTRSILSTNTVKIYFGDPVLKTPSSGNIAQATTNTLTIDGVFQGCMLIPTTGGPPTWSPYWPGGAGATATAYVMEAPGAKFLAAALNTQITASAIGLNVGFDIGTGSTIGAGLSGATVDQSTLSTTNTLPFQVVGMYQGIGNGSDIASAYNWVEVTFNNQRFKQLTGVA